MQYPIVDSHQDIAFTSLFFGRDFLNNAFATRELEKKSEKYQLILKQAGECCNGLPNLLEGGIVMVLSTLWACPPVPEMAEG